MTEPLVREYPDIPARVIGKAYPEAAMALWRAVIDWTIRIEASANLTILNQAVRSPAPTSSQPGQAAN